MNLSEYMTPDEVANLFGVNVGTIYLWRKKGILVPDFVYPNKRALYSPDTVNKLFNSMIVKKEG